MKSVVGGLVLAAILAACAPSTHAQVLIHARDPATGAPATMVPRPPALAAAPAPPPPPVIAPQRVTVPEGTEVRLRLGERLTSSTAHTGDTFSVILDEEMKLPDGTVIPAGYSGRGEVVDAEHNGALGKSGKLALKLDYLRVGESRIRLRANQSQEGKSGVTNTVVMTVLFGIPGLLVHGHSAVYVKGAPLVGYVDQDAELALPLTPPPITD